MYFKVTFVAHNEYRELTSTFYYNILSIIYVFLSLFLVTFVPKRIVESFNKNKAFQLTRVSFSTKIEDKGR